MLDRVAERAAAPARDRRLQCSTLLQGGANLTNALSVKTLIPFVCLLSSSFFLVWAAVHFLVLKELIDKGELEGTLPAMGKVILFLFVGLSLLVVAIRPDW